jgi:hypothetical protein
MLNEISDPQSTPVPVMPFIVHAKIAEPKIQLPKGVAPPESHRCQIFLVAATSIEDAKKLLGICEAAYDFIDVFSIDDLLGKTHKFSKDQPA